MPPTYGVGCAVPPFIDALRMMPRTRTVSLRHPNALSSERIVRPTFACRQLTHGSALLVHGVDLTHCSGTIDSAGLCSLKNVTRRCEALRSPWHRDHLAAIDAVTIGGLHEHRLKILGRSGAALYAKDSQRQQCGDSAEYIGLRRPSSTMAAIT